MTPDAWLLSSKLAVVREAYVQAASIDFHVYLDSETLPATVGDARPKVATYATDRWLCVVPAITVRKIGGNAIGQRGHATLMGASACAALLSLPPGAVPAGGEVRLHLSDALRTALGPTLEEFLTGLLHRGVTLKIPSRGPTQSSSQCPSKSLRVVLDPERFDQSAFDAASSVNDAMVLARSLVNMPANILHPQSYEDFVRGLVARETARLASQTERGAALTLEVFDASALERERCGLILAVGKASDVPPRLLKLTYEPASAGKVNAALPAGRNLKHVALVGKGITFDTGGLDIKASNFMRNMKKDMGGSAAALGAFLALVRRNAPLRVTCYLALAENMISGRAMRPGDVYAARNGLTVEIDNTDAEGRLVLADALCMASQAAPDWIIDLATLTGAARTALGGGVDALFSNDPGLENLLFHTGLEMADPVWPMPLVDDYEPLLESSVADLVNSTSTPHGGAITAALFLRKFVGNVPWSHLDTYMWTDRPGDIYAEPGATAKCVRLVEAAVRAFAVSEPHAGLVV